MKTSIHSIGTCLKKDPAFRIGDAMHHPRQIHRLARPIRSQRIHPRQIHKLADRAVSRLKRRIIHEVKTGKMVPVSHEEMAAWGL